MIRYRKADDRFYFRLEDIVMDEDEMKDLLMQAKRVYTEKENEFVKKLAAVAAPSKPPFSRTISGEDASCERCGAKVANRHRIVHQNWHAQQKDELLSMAVDLVKMLAAIPDLESTE